MRKSLWAHIAHRTLRVDGNETLGVGQLAVQAGRDGARHCAALLPGGPGWLHGPEQITRRKVDRIRATPVLIHHGSARGRVQREMTRLQDRRLRHESSAEYHA